MAVHNTNPRASRGFSGRALLLLGLLLFAAGRTDAATFTVGSDAACTHSTIGSALLTAALNGPSYDLIRLSAAVPYVRIGLVISNMSVEIAGGYLDCLDTAANSLDIIDGGGAMPDIAESVFEITGNVGGPHFVTFSNLGIQGGEDDADDGGGLQISGNNIVVLNNTSVRFNGSGNGGGILLDGSDGAILALDADSEVRDNNALSKGGGIYCHSGGIIFAAGDIRNNRANQGGGVFLDACDFTTTGVIAFTGNTTNAGATLTRAGGGVYARNGSSVEIGGLSQPLVMSANVSGVGGGLYLTGSGTSALLENVRLDGNSVTGPPTGEGGAAFVIGGAELVIDCIAAPGGIGEPCSSVSMNAAQAIAPDDARGGALVAASGGQILIRRTELAGNISSTNLGEPKPAAVAMATGSGSSVRFEGAVLFDNQGLSSLLTENGGLIEFRFSTAADNLTDAFAILAGPSDSFDLRTSIVWDPGQDVFGAFSGTSTRFVDCAMVNELATIPISAQTIITVVPGFVNPAAGDYHLTTGSSAIDACDAAVTAPTGGDIDRHTRGFDQLGQANLRGPYDLGADENLAAVALPDLIFSDSFE